MNIKIDFKIGDKVSLVDINDVPKSVLMVMGKEEKELHERWMDKIMTVEAVGTTLIGVEENRRVWRIGTLRRTEDKKEKEGNKMTKTEKVIKSIRTKVATNVALTDAEDVFMSLAVDNILDDLNQPNLGWNIKARAAYQRLTRDKRNLKAYFDLVSTIDDDSLKFEWIADEIIKTMVDHAAGNPATDRLLYSSKNLTITMDIEHAQLTLIRTQRRGKDKHHVSHSECTMQYSLSDLIGYTDYLVEASK